MLARGFDGMLPDEPYQSLGWTDFIVLIAGVCIFAGIHFVGK
jgi:energy-coupling factor transporter transmembrane protein EcfT